jgi:hypothetical protein
MYCEKCGAANEEGALQCANCGADLQPVQPAQPTEQTQQIPPVPPVQPNQQQPYQDSVKKPQNYLVWAIIGTAVSLLSTLLCVGIGGLVTGIIAIVFAAQVDSKWNMGDFQGAYQTSSTAKILTIITCALAALGLICVMAYVAFLIYAVSSGSGQPHTHTYLP